MTQQTADQMVGLLVKMVKLQRLMKLATLEQRKGILEVADRISDELVDNFEGSKVWCMALLTFGGQYFGQDTAQYVGDAMDIVEVQRCLRAEVYQRNGLQDVLRAEEEVK